MMPSGSDSSEKYTVYTVTSDDDDSDESNTCFKEREELTPEGKSSSGLSSFPSLPSDMSHWGKTWTKREKWCCFLNIVMTFLLVGGTGTFVYFNKDRILGKEDSGKSTNKTQVKVEVLSNPGSTSASPAESKTCYTRDCVHLAASVLSRMDIRADPCKDFHEYSCGGFQANTPLSWQNPRVREDPDELNRKHDAFLIDTLSSSERSVNPGVDMVRKAFQTCVDEDVTTDSIQNSVRETVNSLGRDIKDSDDVITSFTKVVARAYRDFGASPLFSVTVLKNGKIVVFNKYSDKFVKTLFRAGLVVPSFRYLMPSDFYFRQLQSDRTMQEYVKYVRKTMTYLVGNNTKDPTDSLFYDLKNKLVDYVSLEARIVQAQYDEMSSNLSDEISTCKQRMRIGTLQRYYGGYNLNWKLFFEILLDKMIPQNYELCYVDLSTELAKILADVDIESMTNYVKFHSILNTDTISIFQSQISIFSLSTSVYNSVYLQKDLESNCLNLLKIVFPLSATISSPLRRVFEERSASLFIKIKSVLMDTVDDIYWIPTDQRHALIDSIRAVSLVFDWSDNTSKSLRNFYSHLSRITDGDYLSKLVKALTLKYNGLTSGTQISRTFSESLSVYDQWNKEIVISAAAAQIPLVYNSTNAALVFGPTGSFIAQTLAQLLDIEALLRHFMSGVINQEVVLTLAHHLQCLVTYYGNLTIVDSKGIHHKVRSDMTKSANFRDNVALAVLYKAYISSRVDHTSISLPALNLKEEQLLFILYAQTMCEHVNTHGIDHFYMHNQHINGLPGHIRILGVMSNFPKVAEAFSCPKNSALNPKKRCSTF